MCEPKYDDLMKLYNRLSNTYGQQNWWPAKYGGDFEIICGAILSQNTNWGNVLKALRNLRLKDLWDFQSIYDADINLLAETIRPSGYFNIKAKKLKFFSAEVIETFQGDLEVMFDRPLKELRELLLDIWGIGDETADDIIVYVAKKPSFIVDTYTIRLITRLGWDAPEGRQYGDYQKFFETRIPRDVQLYNEFHALIDNHGSNVCKKVPDCKNCCLSDICATGIRMYQAGNI